MLAFGDLVWVPMTYSLQAFWLIDHMHDLPLWAAALILATNLLGQAIFRAVNNQKHTFRGDPDGARIWGRPVEYLQTRHGNKLLLSGFWGWSRHFNYVGDLLMAASWSLPCGFSTPLPWFYPIYFTILLIHRERRDHALCAEKYGADWDAYCARVPWRILPYVY
jgi:steroid 5-alpha reductase family enzyme